MRKYRANLKIWVAYVNRGRGVLFCLKQVLSLIPSGDDEEWKLKFSRGKTVREEKKKLEIFSVYFEHRSGMRL